MNLPVNVVSKDNKNIAHITIDGVIGEVFWGDEVSKQQIKDDVSKVLSGGYDEVHFDVSSLGGDVDHAFSIVDMINELKQEGVKTVTNYTGFNASAATFFGMVTDETTISEFGFFLVHQPWSVSISNLNEAKANIELLEKLTDKIKSLYLSKGVDGNIVDTLMDEQNGNGIWLSAEEALEYKFVDRIVPITSEEDKVISDKVMNSIKSTGLPTDSLERFIPKDTEQKKNFFQKILDKLNNNVSETETEKITKEEMELLNELKERLEKMESILNEIVDTDEVEDTEEVEDTTDEVEEVDETEEVEDTEEDETTDEVDETEEDEEEVDETEKVDMEEVLAMMASIKNELTNIKEQNKELSDKIKNYENSDLSEPVFRSVSDSKIEDTKPKTKNEIRMELFKRK